VTRDHRPARINLPFFSNVAILHDNIASLTVTTSRAHDVPHSQLSNILSATTYSERGIPISQHRAADKTASEGREELDKPGRARSATLAANRMMSD